ncbi:interferon lambda receptor 1 [Pelodytes ibericus]
MSIRFTGLLLFSRCFALHMVFAGVLHPPLNITTVSRNFSLYLIWLPAPENPPDVSYRVNYKRVSQSNWKPVKNCKHITMTECDLTCALVDYHGNYNIRVRTVSVQSSSPWVDTKKIAYMFTVEPDPPILHVTQVDNFLHVQAIMQTPTCLSYIYDLKFDVEIWRNGKSNKIIYSNEMVNSMMKLKTLGLTGNYCMVARTKYTVDQTKLSHFSNAVCQLVNDTVITYYFSCRKTHITKKPDSLDFTNYKSSFEVSVFEEYHRVTIDKKGSSLVLPSRLIEDGTSDYSASGFVYTEKRANQEDGTSNNVDSTCYMHVPTKDLVTYPNSNASCSSDYSLGGYKSKSGLTIPLTLDNIKNKDHPFIQKMIKIDFTNNEIQAIQPTDRSLFESLCVLQLNSQENVLFDTLQIGKRCQEENSDGDLSDQFSSDNEDSMEQSNEDLNGITDNLYSKRQPNSTGYEQRSYLPREC